MFNDVQNQVANRNFKNMKETEPFLKLDTENNRNWIFESEYLEPILSNQSEDGVDNFFEEHQYAHEGHDLLLDDHIHPKKFEVQDFKEVSMIQTDTSFQEHLHDIQHESFLVSDSDGDSIDKESIASFNSEESSKFSVKNEDTTVSTSNNDDDASIASNTVSKPAEEEYSNKPESEENGVESNPADVMEQLQKMMAISAESQKKLQNWDEKRGLPKNHSATMMNTGRSRLQLQNDVILLKWDGTPLTEGLRRIGRKKSARKKESPKQVEIPKKRGRGRPRKVKNVPNNTTKQVELPKIRGRGRPRKVKDVLSK